MSGTVSSIDSILTSRFILNLRLLDSRDPALDISTPSKLEGLPTLSVRSSWFSRQSRGGHISALPGVLANMGAPLDFNPESEDEDGAFSPQYTR
ncbi:hypothetical protein GSI_03825 [Ganoderma sinense ZZ0214-1]|uniref:Uncharacterized protein n=1 Tax=Ganoderma sinense ZZ0214-1 TaxID=1077348 RepID=A0A2G8SK20_9APHY|nr:hypothetical protein GSI_03825 [Ganoderma sinense ZZ0214-1]